MKHIPLVSVVMPCYNSSRFLREAIESVLNQTFKDFEFIIVDDGSTDNTKEIVLSYKDPRVKYIYKSNGGVGSALKIGCSIAKGKYIARMDSDDICFIDRFQKQVEFLESNSDYVLVSSAVIYIDIYSKVIGRSFPYQSDDLIKEVLTYNSPIAQPAVMFLKEAYDKVGGYVELIISEDFYLWNKMKGCGKFYNLCIPLLYYRIVYTSLSHTLSHEFHIHVNKEIYKMSCLDKVTEHDIHDMNTYISNNIIYDKSPKNKMSIKVYLMWKIASYILGMKFSSELFCYLKTVFKSSHFSKQNL